jgi:hypothetical protein
VPFHQRRGISASLKRYQKKRVKLSFASEEAKRRILDQPFPFESLYLVDVEVKASEGKPALYRILLVKDAFEAP